MASTDDDDSTAQTPPVGARVRSPPRRRLDLEVVAAIVLSVVTVFTAWSAFEATKWGGVMSIRFSEASAARAESARASARVNTLQAVDVGLFTEWVAATARGDDALADFIEVRFRDEFQPAFRAWVASQPLDDPQAPATPFEMAEYVIAEQQRAQALLAEADLRAQQAREANQTGDDYVLTTVLLATVLFFAGISTRFASRSVQVGLLSLGIVVLGVAVGLLASFPVEI